MTLEWKGEIVVRHVEQASSRAMDKIIDRAESLAAAETPVLTGAARDSIDSTAHGLVRVWGYGVDYGIWIEIGANGRPGVHALRRAADVTYPELAPAIRMELL